jgi:hypothetical protein
MLKHCNKKTQKEAYLGKEGTSNSQVKNAEQEAIIGKLHHVQ